MILSVEVLAAGLLIAATQIDPMPVDQQRAEMYFREAKELCDRDNGRLWGCLVVRTHGVRRCKNPNHQPPRV